MTVKRSLSALTKEMRKVKQTGIFMAFSYDENSWGVGSVLVFFLRHQLSRSFAAGTGILEATGVVSPIFRGKESHYDYEVTVILTSCGHSNPFSLVFY
jgi:hypothetical protein